MKNTYLLYFLLSTLFVSCSSDESSSDYGNVINKKLNKQATGSSANDILSSTSYKKMIVELAYIEGFKPTEKALNNFKEFINNRINKPEGVNFITKQIPATGRTKYSLEEIVDIEEQYRTKYNTNNKIALWVLFVNGKSANDTNSNAILGSAYWNTSFVIYEETIQGLSDSAFEPNRSVLETSVINHEFGHILGLTNLGTDLQSDHEDANHPKHCNVDTCLMYWAAETSQGISKMLSGGSAPTLDAQCLADLKANGGK